MLASAGSTVVPSSSWKQPLYQWQQLMVQLKGAAEGAATGAVETGSGSYCEPAVTEGSAILVAAGASAILITACFLQAVAMVAAEGLYLAAALSWLAVVWPVTAAAAEPAVVTTCILMPQRRGVHDSSGIHSLLRVTPQDRGTSCMRMHLCPAGEWLCR